MKRSIPPFERHSVYLPETDGRLTVHFYAEFETLTGLAQRYYGDWRLWRLIANRNNIVDARRIVPGTQLFIPARPAQDGAFEVL
jgi:nucleoid-associated protein YgaU